MAKKPPPGGLNVVPETATIKVGVTQFVFCNEPAASWSSSDPAIASVDGLVSGAVLGVAPGTATITARHRNKRGTMTITVEALEIPPPDLAEYGPRTDVVQPAGSVVVLPGVNTIQAAIAQWPTGTTFWITEGMYALEAPIRPKTDQVLLGEYGAILNGANVQQDYDQGGIAVVSGWNAAVSGVTVRNLVILGRDAIHGVGAFGPAAGGWTVDHCEIANCRWGVAFGRPENGTAGTKQYVPGPTITGNLIRDCIWSGASSTDGSGAYGIQTADGTVMLGNEITRCGAQHKFVNCIRSRVAENYLHDGEMGIWFDGDNLETTIEDNRIEDHTGESIMCEISSGFLIRRNTVKRSGVSGVFVSTSRQVTITENNFEANFRDINLFVQTASAGLPPDQVYPGSHTWDLSDVTVSGNTIRAGTTPGTIAAGLSGSGSPAALAPYLDGSKNLVFSDNRYSVPAAGSWWAWEGAKTWAEWNSLGHDLDGVLIIE